MSYAHEIVGAHGGALLPERRPGENRGAKSLGKNQHRFGGTRDGTKQMGDVKWQKYY